MNNIFKIENSKLSKLLLILIFVVFGFMSLGVGNAEARCRGGWHRPNYLLSVINKPSYDTVFASLKGQGYICTTTSVKSSTYRFEYNPFRSITGIKTVYSTSCVLNKTTYSATTLSSLSLKGVANTTSNKNVVSYSKKKELIPFVCSNHSGSPFIYFQNPPEGNISTIIHSALDTYFPKPDFNKENGWLVNSHKGKLSVNGQPKDNLFYELELNKLFLNRNGQNFSSKKELTYYLQNSDFLIKLGLSGKQKQNSLDYFIPELQKVKDKKYYYLTVLSQPAINEISSLDIQPAPKQAVRQFFLVYPTNTEVKTTGSFVFPQTSLLTKAFTVKETGEILVKPNMLVFWDKN